MTDAKLLALPVPQQVLVVGRGGREHALVHALGQSGAKVYATRPNPGMAPLCRAVDVDPLDVDGVVAVAQQLQVDLVVVGPEAPLVAGLADALRAVGIATFGPGQDAAQLEGSKAFAKAFLVRHGIPTAAAEVVTDLDAAQAFVARVGAPLVVKADGLAAGKGVVVAETVAEAAAAVRSFLGDKTLGEAGATLLLEQFLTGPEVSALALCDGERILALDLARDHKRIFDGDKGDNTGGMGAVSPLPTVDAATLQRIRTEVLEPTLAGLKRDGLDFRGVIYAGIMLTPTGPQVLEYNVRFGDPEAQVLLPRLGAQLAPLLYAAARGALPSDLVLPPAPAAVTVVLAAAGYPATPRGGDVISGLAQAAGVPNAIVFHAGTKQLADGTIVTAGGRVLTVTGLGPDVAAARNVAYQAAGLIDFSGKQMRTDIAASVVG
jgi:phosphoribosylamine--glycine ligase